MSKYKIAWLPGDGIGKEVLEATRPVLEAVSLDAEFIPGDIGWAFWKKEGNPLPNRTLDLLRRTDCALFGAVTAKPPSDTMSELPENLRTRGVKYISAVLRMRRLLDLYVCLRPCKAFGGNPANLKEHIDIVIFRENTEGLYAGIEWDKVPPELYPVPGMERIQRGAAVSLRAITRKASNRIVRAAFEHAKREGRKKVTAVHKANVLRATCGMFLDSARRIASEYKGIAYEEMMVDACAMTMVKDPLHFDVIVTTNLFGDILSDLAAGTVGGMGFAPSANIGDDYAVFEPAHGSAPDIEGTGKANPIATILSARMMLEWLGEKEKASLVEKAVAEVICEGKVRTPDFGGKGTTKDMTAAIVKKLGH
jgi:isopropylmalate/isohomocitrate dehydrogenase-like protein